jgi:hypothetical protein
MAKLQNELPGHTVYIATNVVSSNPVNDEVYSIQHYVIQFVSVGGFLHQ